MIKIDNKEFIGIIIFLIMQTFIGKWMTLLFIFTMFVYKLKSNTSIWKSGIWNLKDGMKRNENEKETFFNLISKYFKSTEKNKEILSILSTDATLTSSLEELYRFKNVSKDKFQSILYDLWEFIRIFIVTFNYSKPITDQYNQYNKYNLLKGNINNKIEMLIAIRNKIFETFENFKFDDDVFYKEKSVEIQNIFMERMNYYIKLIENKFNAPRIFPLPANI